MLSLLVAVGVMGCGSIGAVHLAGTRERYHDVIRRTSEEQMLLNLVRLQQDDLPFFLQVSTVTAQLTSSLQLSIGPKYPATGELGGILGGNIQESPSIIYQPLQGDDFVHALLKRVPEEALVSLMRASWRVSMVLRLFVHELGPLHNLPVKAPTSPERQAQYQRLEEVLAILDDLTDRGIVDFDLERIPLQVWAAAKRKSKEMSAAQSPPETTTEKTVETKTKNTVTTKKVKQRRSEAEAAGDDADKSDSDPPKTVKTTEKESGKPGEAAGNWEDSPDWPVMRLARPVRDLSPADNQRWARVLCELGVCRSDTCDCGPTPRFCNRGDACERGSAFFLIPSHLRDARFEGVDYITVSTRTLLEVMMTVSGGISVPRGSAHGRPTARCDDSDRNVEAMNDLFHVYCSEHEPHDVAVRVRYNDRWYYLKALDSESRQVFSMLLLMFQEQMPKTMIPLGPVVTLPLTR